MTTLQQFCERPLPISVRIELFCRLLGSLDNIQKRRPAAARVPAAHNAGDIVVGANEAGVVVDNVGLLRVAEVVFALRPSRLVHETAPGAPWVLEHIVARLREGSAPAPTVLMKALQPFRSGDVAHVFADSDDAAVEDALENIRRNEAKALIDGATRLATATGPGEAVLWALDEACRVDPDFADPRDRRARVAAAVVAAGGVDVDHLRVEVQQAMHQVLHQRDLPAAVRVAAVLYGPGADPRRVLEPLGTRVTLIEPVEQERSKAAAVFVVACVAVCAVAGAVFYFVLAPAPPVAAVAVAPVFIPPPAPPTPPTQPTPAPTQPTPAPTQPTQQPPTPTPTQPPSPHQTDLPGPAIVNVWLENCADCLPTFAAWRSIAGARELPAGARVINVAYGSEQATTRDFAAHNFVDDNLRFDTDGSLIVRRTGIGTFTTFVIDRTGQIVWRGRAVDDGFVAALRAAWATVAPVVPPTTQLLPGGEAFEAALRESQANILRGDFKAAATTLVVLEKQRPNDPRVHRNLGICFSRLRDNAKARLHYNRYLELNPAAPDAEKVREILSKR